jgi:hypothetical protein
MSGIRCCPKCFHASGEVILEGGLNRLDAALDKTGPYQLAAILHSVNLKSLDQVDNLETLHKVVVALEAKVDLASRG